MAKMLRYKGKLYKEVESRKVLVDSARARRFGRFARRRFVDDDDDDDENYLYVSIQDAEYAIDNLCDFLEKQFLKTADKYEKIDKEQWEKYSIINDFMKDLAKDCEDVFYSQEDKFYINFWG